MKRILLYVHYNKYDNLSSHVLYQLEKMRPLFEDILFISNSNLSKSDKDKLEKAELITDFLQRKNSGFDFVAWKDGFQKLGFENVSEYEFYTGDNPVNFLNRHGNSNLIFDINNSIYIPLNPTHCLFIAPPKLPKSVYEILKGNSEFSEFYNLLNGDRKSVV